MANADTEASGGKMFTEDAVAAILAANNITSITMATYEVMSALDGKRTASGFQHQFRSVIKRSKELKARIDNGEKFQSVTPAKKRGAKDYMENDDGTPPATPVKKPKGNPRAKATPKSAGGRKKKNTMLDDVDQEAPETPTHTHFQEAFHEDMVKKEEDWDEV